MPWAPLGPPLSSWFSGHVPRTEERGQNSLNVCMLYDVCFKRHVYPYPIFTAHGVTKWPIEIKKLGESVSRSAKGIVEDRSDPAPSKDTHSDIQWCVWGHACRVILAEAGA